MDEFGHRVTIGGVLASYVSEVHARFGIAQPVATCSLTMPVELATSLSDGASVTVELQENGVWWTNPIFSGRLVTPERTLTTSGNLATLSCVGPCDRLSLPLEKDYVFTGGAKESPQTLQTSPMHIGNSSVSWYLDPSPNGTSVDIVKTPLVDSNFVWINLELHGTNSYPTSLDDKKIKKWSRIELWQGGVKLGYANFPENAENYDEEDPPDYSDDENWDEVELLIAATKDVIDASDGDITFKLISGQKPGTTLYDEYEIRNATWQTAGKQSLRQIARGILASGGFSTSQYSVNDGVDLDGVVIKLGGNGLVDAGQLRIAATESRLSWISGLAALFGYYLFDCPDGVIRFRPVRGIPVKASVATFIEGISIHGIPRSGRDASRVFNSVLVEGASGTDPNGKQFAYSSQTADGDVIANPLIPNPPGIKVHRVSSTLLTSNALCAKVRAIKEVTMADVLTLDFDTKPIPLYPSQTVTIDAPTVEVDDTEFFVTGLSYDIDSGGYRMSVSVERGTAVPFADLDDPSPAESPIAPTVPRPVNEWAGGYTPKAVVN